MGNLATMRIMALVVTLLATALGIVAGYYWSFPMNVGGIILAVAALGATVYFSMKAEKKARFDTFYSAIQNLGTPVSFDNYSAAFEKDGTRFEITYPRGESETALKINFFLTGHHQRFMIRHQSIFLTSLSNCPYLQNSPLSPDIQLYAQNPDFLVRFVQIPAIRDEIYEYPPSFFSKLGITFDAGNFELLWTPKMGEQTDSVYKICKTAVVFHDELKKLR